MYTDFNIDDLTEDEIDILSEQVTNIIEETMFVEGNEDFVDRYRFLQEQGKDFAISFDKVDRSIWQDYIQELELEDGQTLDNDFIQATFLASLSENNNFVDFNYTNNDLLALAYVLICKSDKDKCSIIYCDKS